MSIKDKNKLHNIQLENSLKKAMINGQNVGIASEFKYGLCNMGFNGCEVISVYNALVYCDKSLPLWKIAFIMEKYRLALGFFGCSPYCFDKLYNTLGLNAVKVCHFDGISAFIISFWTKIPFLSSIHTVFCTAGKNGSITVYNRYNNTSSPSVYKSMDKFIGNRKIISAYSIK